MVKLKLIFCLFFISLTAYPAVFIVDNTGDTDDAAGYTIADGTNTLRKCIRLANANAGADDINFNISAAPYLITAAAALPTITDPVYIDGLTQPGASAGNPLIEIDGAGLNVLELAAGAGGSTIRGLVLYGANRGIYINSSSGNTIIANHIGTNQGATAVAPAILIWNGIEIGGTSSNNIIGGTGGINTRNIISGANEQGIRIQGTSTGTQIIGNYIGTNIDATAAIPNVQNGIFLLAGSHNTIIGGNTTDHRNIISRNGQRGVFIQNSSDCIISNNFIGTSITGNAALGNIMRGIEVENNSANTIITNNLICSNAQQGIMITSNSHRPIITGNRIGLGMDGITQLGNTQHGIEIQNSFKPTIGGSLLSERNYVSNNGQMGIRIDNGDSVIIKGNYIGVNESGLLDHGNTQIGLLILQSDDVQLGGSLAGEGNIISGNNQRGAVIENNSARPVVKGNKIGLGADGITMIGNGGHGLHLISSVLLSSTFKPIVGGILITERNFISNNGNFGIRIEYGDSAVIKNNYIGVDESGLLDHGNNQIGLLIVNSANVTLGGSLAGEGNIISGNTEAGVVFENNCPRPVIKGNKIGLGANGLTQIGNGQYGMRIANSIKPIIGGIFLSERNYVSNNGQYGIRIESGDSAVIKNNYIGVDQSGLLDHGNNQTGLVLLNSDDVILGGPLAGEGNIVSGNNQQGVVFENNCPRAVIKGNKIGLGADGLVQIGNGQVGLRITNSIKPIIGGMLVNERNYISNNAEYGMRIENGDSAIIKNNYIGVDATGLLDHGNNQVGLYVSASDDVILGGAITGEGNIISGNTERGAVFDNSPMPVVKGNIIGLGADRSTAIGNGQIGLHIINSTTATIGGSTLAERNYVSSNGGHGMDISGCPYTIIKGNYIGVDVTGILNIGNNNIGIRLDNSRESIIGGGNPGERNIISGSKTAHGLEINGNSPRCIIKGNFAGVGADGVTDLGNWNSGFNLYGEAADSLIIGGSSYMERNVCSGNGKSGTGDGIRIEFPDDNIISGNFCGVDSTGTIKIGNAWAGISLNESNDNLVGGPGAFEGNICSGNLNEGMWLRNALRNRIYGNFVGTDRSGTLQIGNEDWGIAISPAAPNFDNIIGGSPANANTIAYNLNLSTEPGRGGQGVYIDNASHRNLITYNKIYCNAGLGIDRDLAGNENIDVPIILESFPDSLHGTGIAGDTIHVYRNLTADAGSACDCEGEIFLGKATVAIDNTWLLIHNLGLTLSEARSVTATQTNLTNSTSEFSDCLPSCALTIMAQASDTLVNADEPDLIDFTSSISFNPFFTDTIKYYWAVSSPDTTGALVFSNDTSATLDLSSGSFPAASNGNYLIYLIATQSTCIDTALIELHTFQILCELMVSVQASDSIINTFNPQPINLTSSVSYNPLVTAPVKYFWSANIPDTTGISVFSVDTSAIVDLSSGNFTVSSNGNHWVYLIVTHDECADTVLIELKSYQIPNLVTPNNDNHNDKWEVTTSSQLFDAEIYNRWGELIFTKEGYTNEWDISEVSDGIYFFQLKSKGNNLTDYKGWVQVTR